MSARVNSAVWLLSNAVRYFAATLSSSMPADDVSSCVVGGNRGYYRPNPISFSAKISASGHWLKARMRDRRLWKMPST